MHSDLNCHTVAKLAEVYWDSIFVLLSINVTFTFYYLLAVPGMRCNATRRRKVLVL
jgi:hypothetical protein